MFFHSVASVSQRAHVLIISHQSTLIHLSMLSPSPQCGEGGDIVGFDQVESQIPLPGGELSGQIPTYSHPMRWG